MRLVHINHHLVDTRCEDCVCRIRTISGQFLHPGIDSGLRYDIIRRIIMAKKAAAKKPAKKAAAKKKKK
jgi:hypothetical protein